MSHSVIVYSSPFCSHCTLAKNFLKEQGISFEEVNVYADRIRAQEIMKRSGQMSLPQIEINGEIIVGFDKSEIQKRLGL